MLKLCYESFFIGCINSYTNFWIEIGGQIMDLFKVENGNQKIQVLEGPLRKKIMGKVGWGEVENLLMAQSMCKET